MARGRYRIDPTEITETFEELNEQVDEAEEAETVTDETGTGTIDDLIQDTGIDPARSQVLIPADDMPLEVDSLPIPKPWMGLRRAAIVYNFNFVYDDDTGEWVRQHPFENLPGRPLDTITGTVSNSTTDTRSFDTTAGLDTELLVGFRVSGFSGGFSFRDVVSGESAETSTALAYSHTVRSDGSVDLSVTAGSNTGTTDYEATLYAMDP